MGEEVRPKVRYTEDNNGDAILVHMDGTPFAPNEVGMGGGAMSAEVRLLRHLEQASSEDADRFRSRRSPLSVAPPVRGKPESPSSADGFRGWDHAPRP